MANKQVVIHRELEGQSIRSVLLSRPVIKADTRARRAGDDPEWLLALTAQQSAKEPLGCTLMAARLADGFVRNNYSAFGQKIFNFTEAQAKR